MIIFPGLIKYDKDYKIFFHIILLIFFHPLYYYVIILIDHISMKLFGSILEQLLEFIQGHSNHTYLLNPKENLCQIFIILFDLFCLERN